MSHLSTLIYRVKRRLDEVYKGDVQRAAQDSLWRQSIRNLREYQESWTDQTEEEITEANRLYSMYIVNIKTIKKMNKQNVKQTIQELAGQNFNLYPEMYKPVNGLATEESILTAQQVAISYWEHREEDEIERDEDLGITKIDYVDWVMAEYETYVQNLLDDDLPDTNEIKGL